MDDLISRQAAIDALREAENHAFNSFYQGLIKAHKIIADLPSAQPEPQTGHWIDEGQHTQMDMGYHRFRCSQCGGYIFEARTDAFCKWCGSYNGERK